MRFVVAVVVATVVVTGCSATPRSTEEAGIRSATEEAVAATVTPPPIEPEPTIVPLPPDQRIQPEEEPDIESFSPAEPTAPVVEVPAPAPPETATPIEATTQETIDDYTLNLNSDGSTVRWNPCSTIRWKANLTLAPDGALDALRAAMDDLATATGMTFTYAGATSALPTKAWLEGTVDSGTILVAWVPKGASDLWSGNADGEGGWYKRGVSTNGVTWTWRIERGFVLIDPTSTAAYAAGFSSGVSLGALLLHELAHTVGLGHIDDDSQLMYPTLSSSTDARYAEGDRAGLARLGRDAGCIV